MNAGDLIQERYRLEEELGRGGMATVWRALDERLQRRVAIKFLAASLSDDPEFLVRLFSEAQSVSRISHPNVVRVLDFGEQDGSPYLVMECVPGGSLAARSGIVDKDEAFRLVAGAASGAGAAHNLGVVHRDIKPANILLDEDGEPKLADFGIASSARWERLTATGAAIGSPHYISPEQLSGGSATPRSDVYSLGIVLYELLTGRRPFEAKNITAVAIAQIENDPEPPSELVPEIDLSTDQLVMRCLDKDPARRFNDGKELASALRGTASPVALFDDSTMPGTAGEVKGRRSVLVGSTVVLLLLSTLGVGAISADRDSGHTQDVFDRIDVGAGGGDRKGGIEVSGLGTAASPSPSPSRTEADEASPSRSPTATRRRRAGGGAAPPPPTPTPTEEEEQPSPAPSGSASP